MRTQITTLAPVKALLELLRRDPPDAEIPDDSEEGMDERPAARAVRWNFILVWFMRMLALIWIAKGLGYWAVILGADSAPMPFEFAQYRIPGDHDLLRHHRPRRRGRAVADLDLGRGAVAPGRDEPPDPHGVLSPDRHRAGPS